jgi:hypothetical protein
VAPPFARLGRLRSLTACAATTSAYPPAPAPLPCVQFRVQTSWPHCSAFSPILRGLCASWRRSSRRYVRSRSYLYEHMFWRFTDTSAPIGAVHRALGLARALLVLESADLPGDVGRTPAPSVAASRQAVRLRRRRLELAHGPVESRALQSHCPQSRAGRRRWRAGAVLERPQRCLCPITSPVRSRPCSRALDKRTGGSLRLGG